MAMAGQRKCLSCGVFFTTDCRNRARQRCCCAVDCQRASKSASRAAWLSQPANAGYFRDPVHVARVQAWRIAHPGYSRGKPRLASALQEPLIAQVPDSIGESANHVQVSQTPASAALQDSLMVSSPLLAGLIAHLFELSLQEDMAQTTRRLVQLGHDMINGVRSEASQATPLPAARSPVARTVQLG